LLKEYKKIFKQTNQKTIDSLWSNLKEAVANYSNSENLGIEKRKILRIGSRMYAMKQ